MYNISGAVRKTMHEVLDEMIDKINTDGLDDLFACPVVSIELTNCGEDGEVLEYLTYGIEMAEYADPNKAPSIECRSISDVKYGWEEDEPSKCRLISKTVVEWEPINKEV